MAFKRSWLPLFITALVMIMLALAWLPLGDLTPEQRSNKPFLYVSYEIQGDVNIQHLEDVAFDVRQRIEQRHEWRLLDQLEPRAWQLTVTVTSEQLLVLMGHLEAPASDGPSQSVQRFKVQGPADSYAALPEQFVKILIQLVENGHNAQSNL
ncbi:hypothetical protein [Pseudidiomarina sp.]|uniref:hypothetical protein n=1 Tax=Pseudidiomarina sp. TaxID=2081707 RepID=UPI003A979467